MIDQSGTSPHRFSRPLVAAAIVFLLVTLLSAMLVWRLDHLRLQKDRTRVASLTGDYANALQRNIERALSATYALAAMVRQGNGHFPNFDEMALQMLPLYPGADSLQLAPGGVTRQIVPLAGNEKGIGRDLLTDPLRNKEALLARDSGKLTLAGPFELIQGGTGVVGRFPVFLDNEAGHKFFWGFTSIVIRFPDILDTARLSRLTDQGFAYELSRVHPDSGERQIITASTAIPLSKPVEQVLELPNGIWTLSVAPVKGWSNPLGLSTMASLGLLLSFLMAYLAKLLVESKTHEARLEELVVERTAKIREGEERLRLLEDNLPDSYVFQYLQEEEGSPRFLYLSAGVERLHGLSRQVVLDDIGALYQQIDPGQMSDLREAVVVSEKKLTDLQMDLHVRHAGGQWRWLKVRARPQQKVAGRAVWDGVVSDVTSHKQAEDEVRKSAARYRELFEANPHPMWVYNLESLAFLAVNDAAISHYGYSRDEFLTMSIRDIRPLEEVPKLLENISKVSHGVDEAGAWWHCKKDGSLILVEITSHTLDFAGHPAELVLAHDITERHRTESALRESEERLNLFIEHAPAALAMFDREMRYLAVSHRWLADFSLGEMDIIGHSHYEIFPEITEAWKTVHRRGLAGEVLCADEDRFERTDGTSRWKRWEVRPWHAADGSIGGIVIFTEDITERKQADLAIRKLNEELEDKVRERTAQLVAVNKELEAFSYSVSHDLKAPLRGIDGYSQILEEDYHEQLDAEGRRFLQNIRNGTAQMYQLIEDLLDYSRMERRSLQSSKIDLLPLVRAVVAERLPEAEPSGLLVRLQVPDNTVLADRDGLIIVLRNLLENAIKFSRDAAQPPAIDIGARSEGDKTILWVRDNGIGFDMKFHDRIFDMFQRLQRAEDYPGTGIGLALVRKAMQRMGGRVWAESSPGAGATFYLELPQ
ncbi:PAS domain S-box protein [Desulfuromonas sp. AOP6]|uniref:PAS domain S-box protein n=1 Tax=Desulfuromonas sp. AOP6 TaxID=1566351 RepID=UPI0012DDF16D|nr:PAS domain S-box protein [Desulfuromonas sp. AOP6]